MTHIKNDLPVPESLSGLTAFGRYHQMKDTPRNYITHIKFLNQDIIFRAACDAAKIPPTKRQVSKFRNGRGKAFDILRYQEPHILKSGQIQKQGEKL